MVVVVVVVVMIGVRSRRRSYKIQFFPLSWKEVFFLSTTFFLVLKIRHLSFCKIINELEKAVFHELCETEFLNPVVLTSNGAIFFPSGHWRSLAMCSL